MKKLFALLVVAGMVFVSCGNKPAETVDADATVEETTIEEATEEVAEMPAEETAEEAETPAE